MFRTALHGEPNRRHRNSAALSLLIRKGSSEKVRHFAMFRLAPRRAKHRNGGALMWHLILAILLLSVAPACFAQKAPYDGSSTQFATFAALYERALANRGVALPDELEDIGYFKGFITGVVASYPLPCMPVVSLKQVWAVVAKHMRENPERWGVQARDLVLESIDRVWGCTNSPAKTNERSR